MIRPIQAQVFLNHHDTWSYVVEAINGDGVRVSIHGRAGTQRKAHLAAQRAQAAVADAMERLKA
jgi:hypothetical protein